MVTAEMRPVPGSSGRHDGPAGFREGVANSLGAAIDGTKGSERGMDEHGGRLIQPQLPEAVGDVLRCDRQPSLQRTRDGIQVVSR
jgi:hypothetical protein